jgi:hypothetical protein
MITVCLPTFGSPFTTTEKITNKTIKVPFIIHPMFIKDEGWNKIWQIISNNKYIGIYGLDDGAKYCVNVATITKKRGGCPHMFGEIFVTIDETVLQENNWSFPTEEEMEKIMDKKLEDEDEDEDEN